MTTISDQRHLEILTRRIASNKNLSQIKLLPYKKAYHSIL
jgi:hypothetical protein